MTTVNWRTKIDVQNPTESALDVEENEVDVVQQIGEITVDSGAAKNVRPIRKKLRGQRRRIR